MASPLPFPVGSLPRQDYGVTAAGKRALPSLGVAARRVLAGALLALVFVAGFTAGAIVVTEPERAAAEAKDARW